MHAQICTSLAVLHITLLASGKTNPGEAGGLPGCGRLDGVDMPETTHPPQDSDSAPRVIGWCAWHEDIAEGVRVIQVDEQGSGSGGVRRACPPCIDTHGLVPFTERSL
jgi:hypothetical protein